MKSHNELVYIQAWFFKAGEYPFTMVEWNENSLPLEYSASNVLFGAIGVHVEGEPVINGRVQSSNPHWWYDRMYCWEPNTVEIDEQLRLKHDVVRLEIQPLNNGAYPSPEGESFLHFMCVNESTEATFLDDLADIAGMMRGVACGASYAACVSIWKCSYDFDSNWTGDYEVSDWNLKGYVKV